MQTQYQTYYEPEVKIEPRRYFPILTILLVVINVCVFLCSEVTGGSENADHMIQMGAMYQPYFFSGEYYRLITHFFLHFGFEHLSNNMLSLLILGYALEGQIGKAQLLTVYFFSGILAGVSSIVYNISMGEEYVVSAGASGAIYGLMGALLALMVFRRRNTFVSEIPRFLLYIAISIYIGMQDATIDNAAHIGGLVSGFIICACFSIIINWKGRHKYNAG